MSMSAVSAFGLKSSGDTSSLTKARGGIISLPCSDSGEPGAGWCFVGVMPSRLRWWAGIGGAAAAAVVAAVVLSPWRCCSSILSVRRRDMDRERAGWWDRGNSAAPEVDATAERREAPLQGKCGTSLFFQARDVPLLPSTAPFKPPIAGLPMCLTDGRPRRVAAL